MNNPRILYMTNRPRKIPGFFQAGCATLPIDFLYAIGYNKHNKAQEANAMHDQFGSDFMTIVDEDGTEYELEVLSTLEYNGCTYLAVIPADDSHPELDPLAVSIL